MDGPLGILNATLFLLLIFTGFLSFSASAPTDTIAPNQSLADGQLLVSAGENYALGFFRPGKSDRRYVGIWFNKVFERNVVWVANRNSPLNNTSGVLSFDEAGKNLVLLATKNNAALPLWSSNSSVAAGDAEDFSVIARLLDSGNLVVVQKGTERVLWQSFDHPTHTWLPSMKLGLDRKTGRNRVLTSWITKGDPGTGSYTYGIDPTGVPQLFVRRGSAPWWRGGTWNGIRWVGVPEMSDSVIINSSYVDDSDEVSISYAKVLIGNSVFSRLVMDDSGNAQAFTWDEAELQWFLFWSAPKDICDLYGRCGANAYCDPNPDWNSGEFECKCLPGFEPRLQKDWLRRNAAGGCVRKRAAPCGGGDGFMRLAQMKVSDTRAALVDRELSVGACERRCSSDCACTGYSSANARGGAGRGSGCITWFGDLIDMKVYSGKDQGQDFYIRVDAVELANARKQIPRSFRGAKMAIGIVAPLAILAVLLPIFLRLPTVRGHFRRRTRDASLLKMFSSNINAVDGNESETSDNEIMLPVFNLREIKSATGNFSDKLGEGGFGSVYKGQFSNGQDIAVKKLAKHSGQGAEELKNEVLLISRLQHRNLVKVLGCCVEEEEAMLIYEYMPNKSLDCFIFCQSQKALLDWKMRYEIIVGIVRGIIYLHQDSRLRIVHRDLKASNILLDADMNPKISDFGMARIFGGNQTQANTKRVVGTYGYMSPEYALDGVFSTKSDVFSFGVILLEIITGKKNHAFYNDDPLSNLIRHIWDLWKDNRALEIVDSSMDDSLDEFEVLRCLQIGLLCVQEDAARRPSIIDVFCMLSSEATLPSPTKPRFAVRRTRGEIVSGTASRLCSKNDVTITMIEPR